MSRSSGMAAFPPGMWLVTGTNVVKPVSLTRILIVDDYPDALDVWGLYLRTVGFEVFVATDGPRAFDEAVRQKPDVIVMDLELPGKSGYEVAHDLKQRSDTRTIPLIAATGYSHSKQLDQARASGFDSVIVKPCDPESLVAEIRRILSQKTISPANAEQQSSILE